MPHLLLEASLRDHFYSTARTTPANSRCYSKAKMSGTSPKLKCPVQGRAVGASLLSGFHRCPFSVDRFPHALENSGGAGAGPRQLRLPAGLPLWAACGPACLASPAPFPHGWEAIRQNDRRCLTRQHTACRPRPGPSSPAHPLDLPPPPCHTLAEQPQTGHFSFAQTGHFSFGATRLRRSAARPDP